MATLTIPSLVKNYENKVLKNRFKKVYANLAQAGISLVQDNGGTTTGLCTHHSHTPAMWCSKLKCIKTCGNASTGDRTGNCWHDKDVVTNINGDVFVNFADDYHGAVLADGTLMIMGCSVGATTNIELRIDISGFKGPNRLGRDVFGYFALTDEKLILPGNMGTDRCKPGEDTSPIESNGRSCGYKILMNIDY